MILALCLEAKCGVLGALRVVLFQASVDSLNVSETKTTVGDPAWVGLRYAGHYLLLNEAVLCNAVLIRVQADSTR